MRRSLSVALYARICSANGYMHAAVFPEPTAPTMAMPVKRPRSGMTSQRGVSEGICLRGRCTSPTTRESSVLIPGGRVEREFACPNLAACLEGENVDAGKQDRVRNVRRCIEEEGVGVLEEEKRRLRADGHDPEKDIVFREWRPEVERHSRGR